MRTDRSPSVRAVVATCCEFPQRSASSSAPTKKDGPDAADAAATWQAPRIAPASASVSSLLRKALTLSHHRQNSLQVKGTCGIAIWAGRPIARNAEPTYGGTRLRHGVALIGLAAAAALLAGCGGGGEHAAGAAGGRRSRPAGVHPPLP